MLNVGDVAETVNPAFEVEGLQPLRSGRRVGLPAGVLRAKARVGAEFDSLSRQRPAQLPTRPNG